MSASRGSCLAVLVAVVLQTLTLAVSVVFFNRVLHTMQGSFSGGSLSCLKDANHRFLFDDRKSDPCWRVLQQLRHHIEKATAARLEKEISSGTTNKLTGVLPFLPGGHVRADVAAHVTATAATTSSSRTQEDDARSRRRYLGQRVTAWEGHRGQSFLHNVELRGGDLLVRRAGLYYIYAQTYFRLSSPWNKDREEEQDQEGAQLVQYIYKKMRSYTVPILLMKSSRSACWPRGQEPGMFSLNQAGTAFLQPDDRLFVAVGNASAVEADGRASYFGAFLVG
ncbi:tumor necrosis factor ligand superfamily member 10-like isoform X2 [Syngnathoides biaculeatus]|uniref:tumor necrosis factor ligand superfamily member 10-like isoform X2 n=1 Tax=Syngnathoides biaculeatus TaxID=300417 RepID=UPI002ADE874F|nr:tumor necrosis factor ligand superfamily member 10-like isoform X2 [Syngnathoides biaculeatus]